MVGGLALAVAAIDVGAGPDISMRPLYYIPIALAVTTLGRNGAQWIAGACLALWLGSDWFVNSATVHGSAVLWNTAVTVVTFYLLIVVLDHLFSLHREMERRIDARTHLLAAAQARENQLQQELLEVAAVQRAHFGRQLHDGLCQHLTATAMAGRMLEAELRKAKLPSAERATQVISLVEDGIRQCRELAAGLDVNEIVTDLPSYLRTLAETLSTSQGIACEVAIHGNIGLSTAEAETLARIVDEAVRNATKHAAARRVQLTLSQSSSSLELSIQNDGGPFVAPAAGASGLGLGIMRRRAASLGATFSIEALPAGGARVLVRLPHPSS